MPAPAQKKEREREGGEREREREDGERNSVSNHISGVSCPFELKFYVRVRTSCSDPHMTFQFKWTRDPGDMSTYPANVYEITRLPVIRVERAEEELREGMRG